MVLPHGKNLVFQWLAEMVVATRRMAAGVVTLAELAP